MDTLVFWYFNSTILTSQLLRDVVIILNFAARRNFDGAVYYIF